jgi:hypothetical protein
MFKHYLKVSFRYLWKYRSQTLISINDSSGGMNHFNYKNQIILQCRNGFPEKNTVFFNAEMASRRKIRSSAI